MHTAAELRQQISSRPEFENDQPRITLAPGGRGLSSLQLLWSARAVLKRATIAGLLLGTIVAFLLPAKYESTAQLMPPDQQSGSGMAMLEIGRAHV